MRFLVIRVIKLVTVRGAGQKIIQMHDVCESFLAARKELVSITQDKG